MTTAAAPAEHARPRTTRTFFFVTGGRVAMLGAWFLTTPLLINTLGPAGYGLYLTVQKAIQVITGCIGDPLDLSVMREVPIRLQTDRPRALDLIRSAFWLRVGLALIGLLAAVAFPSALRGLATIIMAGVLGDFLLRSGLAYFQVSEQFSRFMAVDAVWQLGRVTAVVALAILHKLTAPTGIAIYVLAPYVSFAVAWPLLPRDVREPARPPRSEMIDILLYSRWVVAGMAMAAAYERLDFFLLQHFRGISDAGIYGSAVMLATVPDFLDGIAQTVIAPKIAPAYAKGRFNQLQWQYLMYAIPFGVMAAGASLLLSRWGFHRFFTPAYAAALPAFRILILSTLFNLVFTPLATALVNFVAPARVTVYTSIGFVWVAAGALWAIPVYGIVGAAMVMLTARILVGTLFFVDAHRLANRRGIVVTTPLAAALPSHMEEQI